MSETVQTIGILSGGALGVALFAIENFFQGDSGASVQVKCGLQCPDCDTFDGDIVNVVGYDGYNREIGSNGGGYVGSGGVLDLTLNQETPGTQTAFLSIGAGNDAVCVSWVSVAQLDGVEVAGGTWTGDLGVTCTALGGGPNYVYPGGEVAGTYREEDGGGEWKPNCMWIDGDLTGDFRTAAIKFEVGAYGNVNAENTIANGRGCAATIFRDTNAAIPDAVPGAASPSKRSVEKRGEFLPLKPWMKDMVVSSRTYAGHNATEICAMPNSWGPDFIGSDGYFCDMSTREVTPVCDSDNAAPNGCIALDLSAGTLAKRTIIAKRQVSEITKTYKHVQDWDSA